MVKSHDGLEHTWHMRGGDNQYNTEGERLKMAFQLGEGDLSYPRTESQRSGYKTEQSFPGLDLSCWKLVGSQDCTQKLAIERRI